MNHVFKKNTCCSYTSRIEVICKDGLFNIPQLVVLLDTVLPILMYSLQQDYFDPLSTFTLLLFIMVFSGVFSPDHSTQCNERYLQLEFRKKEIIINISANRKERACQSYDSIMQMNAFWTWLICICCLCKTCVGRACLFVWHTNKYIKVSKYGTLHLHDRNIFLFVATKHQFSSMENIKYAKCNNSTKPAVSSS